MRALIMAALLGAAAVAPAAAESIEVLGYAGVLGEWELAGTVTATGAARAKEFTGALKVTHVGVCTQDGPEVKDGELRFQLSGASRMKATLQIDGVRCSYDGKLSDSYSGMMNCADRRSVPLKIWLKRRETS